MSLRLPSEFPDQDSCSAVVTNKDSETGVASVQQVDAKIEILTNRFNDLLGIVKNISIQLDEISSGMKCLLNNGKNMDTRGKSTPALSHVESERDIVKEFHNLKQTDTVAEYQERFVELRDLMTTMNYGLTEDYLISSFLIGLKEEIGRVIQKPRPETLIHAFNLARIQEIAIEVLKEKLISSQKRSSAEQTLPSLSVDVFVDYDHPLMFKGSVGEKVITILISTGIPYSFIDTAVALQAGCEIEETEPLLVTFLFCGYQAVSRFRCPKFKWMVQGHEFVADMRIVEIRAYGMLLGFDWVQHHQPLTFCGGGIFLSKEGKEIVLLDKRGSAKS